MNWIQYIVKCFTSVITPHLSAYCPQDTSSFVSLWLKIKKYIAYKKSLQRMSIKVCNVVKGRISSQRRWINPALHPSYSLPPFLNINLPAVQWSHIDLFIPKFIKTFPLFFAISVCDGCFRASWSSLFVFFSMVVFSFTLFETYMTSQKITPLLVLFLACYCYYKLYIQINILFFQTYQHYLVPYQYT